MNNDFARDLEDFTLAWSMPWWDDAANMVWNPPGGMDTDVAERLFHLVPNTARLAYGLLRRNVGDDRLRALAAIDALIEIQYNEPTATFHGTYAQFLESPHPPPEPTVWVDYDPNWRQFVGTTFALMLIDFEPALHAIDPTVVRRLEQSIALAVEGEQDGRIPVHYTNPALMRAWLDAWWGNRCSDPSLVDRGERFARDIVTLHDVNNAFDEFNSPTYYGVDLYALAFWELFPPTPYFATAGTRLRVALWQHIYAFYNPSLRNYCGPFTRSYHPDATQSVTLAALWQWAFTGRSSAPLPDLNAASIDHSHDLMTGTVIGRLAESLLAIDPRLGAPTARVVPRDIHHTLGNGRTVMANIATDFMIGVETSSMNWGGWTQFMPVVAHWRDGFGIATFWLHAPHDMQASLVANSVTITSTQPTLAFRLLCDECTMEGDKLRTAAMHICVETAASVEIDNHPDGGYVVSVGAQQPVANEGLSSSSIAAEKLGVAITLHFDLQ